MQVAGMEGEASRSVVADSTWLALRRVVKDGGGRGLFAGIVPTYMKVMPATAIGAPPHHLRHYWSTLDLQCGVASGLTAVH